MDTCCCTIWHYGMFARAVAANALLSELNGVTQVIHCTGVIDGFVNPGGVLSCCIADVASSSTYPVEAYTLKGLQVARAVY
jgi:hypothetical protein